jgi:hypothetical protein
MLVYTQTVQVVCLLVVQYGLVYSKKNNIARFAAAMLHGRMTWLISCTLLLVLYIGALMLANCFQSTCISSNLCTHDKFILLEQ